jgi:phage shock protein PspC (stress-responsive transcriptional regulator)
MEKLYRTNSSTIGGVCDGLGAYFNIDGTLIKILFIILVFTPFPIITIYLLLWMLIPNKVV